MSSASPAANPPEPNPGLIWDTVNAYQRTAALRGAIELGLFTAIAEGAHTVESLAQRCGATARGIRILCDYLTVIGFLTKDGGAYALTPDTALFLDQRSPAYMGGMVRFINSADLTAGFSDVAALVRNGRTTLPGEGVVDANDTVWEEFARSMVPVVAGAAQFIGETAAAQMPGAIRVLDIAAGHGMFGIEVARRNPRAEITALDWANVLKVAGENAAAAGIAGRHRLLPGDAFQVDFGGPYDLVLVTNFFHHFDLPACAALTRKIHASLKPDGAVYTLEFVPNEDRVSPPPSATFSFMMLGATPAGDAYTFPEYRQLLEAAGFSRNEMVDVPRSTQRLIVSRR